MKLLYKSLIVLLLAISPSDNTLTFTLNCSDTLVGGTPSGVASTVEVLEGAVRWTQHHAATDTPISFTIVSVSGNWNADASTGQLGYVLDQDGHRAELALTGSGGGIAAEFIFHISDAQREAYGLTVESITY